MLSERKTKISVIVPVYKVELYLRCCVDSILAQTFTDFELILVDDGSPDNCGVICDEYAQMDNRVIVIHQDNGGLSAARNTGLDWVFANSDSSWITFVDSDDYIPLEYLEQLYKYAVLENADIVSVWPVIVFDSEREITISETVRYQVYTGKEVCMSVYAENSAVEIAAWGKLVRRELYATLRFPRGKINEDWELTPQLLFIAGKVVSLNDCWYCYRQRPGSILNSGFSIKRFDIVDTQDALVTFFVENNDLKLANLAECKKNHFLAVQVVKAWLAKQYSVIPAKYKIPVWKAIWMLLADTIRSGGIKLVFQRFCNMFRFLSGKGMQM